jgi:acyl-CoA synthetase (AMP-forming)/AMP-acid ligase II/acyl carrier protein
MPCHNERAERKSGRDKDRQASAGAKGGRARGASRMFSSLSELLATHARSAPTRSAILGLGCAPLTYAALWVQAKDMARELRTRGVGPQDRVAVVLPHGPEAAATVVAVAANAVCAPLNPGFTADEWRRYFTDLRIAALVTRADMDSASRTVAHGLGIAVIDLPLRSSGSLADAVSTSAPRTSDNEVASGAADAFVLLTSGSTSRPKIVPLTHAAVCRSAHNVGATLSLTPRDRLLGVLPLFHVHGLVSGLLAVLAAGSSVACMPGFDANGFVDWLTEFRPTWYTAVPAIHRAVLSVAAGHASRMRRSSLRIIRSASSTMPPDLTRGLERLFGVPVIDTFGMTEAASQIAANPVARRKAGSVGRSAGAEIAIMDQKGRRLPTGKRGEIALRGPTVTRGYDNDPAATEAAFQKGWFRTGDLGYLDRDGYLFIVGRIKDIINRGGQKVAPAEVEQVLMSHPEVVEACAFGVPHKRLGEDVAAAVVLRRDAEVSVNGLRDFVRGRLAAFKVPGLIHIVPEIPKGPAGKVKRGELAAALSTPRPQDRADGQGKSHTPRSDLEQQLAAAWMEFLDLDRIGRDDDVFTLGADSISLVQMLSRLRAWLNVDLSLKDLFDAPTVAALAARLASSEHSSSSGLPRQYRPPTDITQARGLGPQPVSIVQEQVLRIDRELPGLPQFNRSVGYRLRGPLDVAAFADSLAEVVRRHASLRTRFAWRNG